MTDSSRQPTDPPPNALPATPDPRAPKPGQRVPAHYQECYGCGPELPYGLRMDLAAVEGCSVEGWFEVDRAHQGAPGLIHGGVLAAAFDEILGASNWLLMQPAVTARLEVDFRAPVAVDTRVWLRAEVVGVAGRKVYTKGWARAGDRDGPAIANAAGLFVQVSPEHFSAHGRAEDVERAVAGESGSGSRAWQEIGP